MKGFKVIVLDGYVVLLEKTLGWRIWNLVQQPVRPPWLFVEPIVDLQILNSQLKSREGVDICEVFYNHLNDEFNGYLDIYTDGSKDPQSGQTGAAPNMEHQRWESK